ncbi:hypothetical protein GQ55_6G174600 [Panicum hallii var. hallii]|uniref:Uncharacterized protein n=1 Tax=Panicum hallii var. hallii TaxID=1504633 RepID=A0A2T7D6W1_9POAL|nr:hypothetical protein GQ55_6G174600 [Panicum hallii var. hallii]
MESRCCIWALGKAVIPHLKWFRVEGDYNVLIHLEVQVWRTYSSFAQEDSLLNSTYAS